MGIVINELGAAQPSGESIALVGHAGVPDEIQATCWPSGQVHQPSIAVIPLHADAGRHQNSDDAIALLMGAAYSSKPICS